MEFLKRYKIILIVTGVVLVAVLGYYYWSANGSGNVAALSSVSGPTQTTSAGQDILNILSQLRQLHIDGSLFSNPAFKSLVDYYIATSSEPIGRPNPFEPLPFEIQQSQQSGR